MNRVSLSILLLTLSLLESATANPLFPDDIEDATALNATLNVDLRAVMQSDAPEQPGKLVVTTPGGTQTFNVKVSPRGKSRQERCRFFPLWINFKKSEVKDTLFEGQNKLKLVTHCSSSLANKGYVPAEMLAYQLFNLLTDVSFRVRPVNMTYVDGDRDNQYPAFFIEHKKNLAKRLDAQILEVGRVSINDLEPSAAARVTLFQYMLGYTYFSLVRGPDPDECCHNAVPLMVNGEVISVPYDFDVTGFVNVPYAAPVPSLGIKKLTQRLFRGYCEHNDFLPAEIDLVKERQDRLLTTTSEFDALEGLRHKRHVRFLEAFFKTIESDKTTQSRIYRRCR